MPVTLSHSSLAQETRPDRLGASVMLAGFVLTGLAVAGIGSAILLAVCPPLGLALGAAVIGAAVLGTVIGASCFLRRFSQSNTRFCDPEEQDPAGDPERIGKPDLKSWSHPDVVADFEQKRIEVVTDPDFKEKIRSLTTPQSPSDLEVEIAEKLLPMLKGEYPYKTAQEAEALRLFLVRLFVVEMGWDARECRENVFVLCRLAMYHIPEPAFVAALKKRESSVSQAESNAYALRLSQWKSSQPVPANLYGYTCRSAFPPMRGDCPLPPLGRHPEFLYEQESIPKRLGGRGHYNDYWKRIRVPATSLSKPNKKGQRVHFSEEAERLIYMPRDGNCDTQMASY